MNDEKTVLDFQETTCVESRQRIGVVKEEENEQQEMVPVEHAKKRGERSRDRPWRERDDWQRGEASSRWRDGGRDSRARSPEGPPPMSCIYSTRTLKPPKPSPVPACDGFDLLQVLENWRTILGLQGEAPEMPQEG